jgi:hypothetical protein
MPNRKVSSCNEVKARCAVAGIAKTVTHRGRLLNRRHSSQRSTPVAKHCAVRLITTRGVLEK